MARLLTLLFSLSVLSLPGVLAQLRVGHHDSIHSLAMGAMILCSSFLTPGVVGYVVPIPPGNGDKRRRGSLHARQELEIGVDGESITPLGAAVGETPPTLVTAVGNTNEAGTTEAATATADVETAVATDAQAGATAVETATASVDVEAAAVTAAQAAAVAANETVLAAGNNTDAADVQAACIAAAMAAAVNETAALNGTVAVGDETMTAIANACGTNVTDVVGAAVAMNGTISADNSTDVTSSGTGGGKSRGGHGSGNNGKENGKGKGKGKGKGGNNAVTIIIDDALKVITDVVGKDKDKNKRDANVKSVLEGLHLIPRSKQRREPKHRESVVRRRWAAGLDERAF